MNAMKQSVEGNHPPRQFLTEPSFLADGHAVKTELCSRKK